MIRSAIDTVGSFSKGYEAVRQDQLDQQKLEQMMYERKRQDEADARARELWALQKGKMETDIGREKKFEQDMVGLNAVAGTPTNYASAITPDQQFNAESTYLSKKMAENPLYADKYSAVKSTQEALAQQNRNKELSNAMLMQLDGFKNRNVDKLNEAALGDIQLLEAQIKSGSDPNTIATNMSKVFGKFKEERDKVETTNYSATIGKAIQPTLNALLDGISKMPVESRSNAIRSLQAKYPDLIDDQLQKNPEYQKLRDGDIKNGVREALVQKWNGIIEQNIKMLASDIELKKGQLAASTKGSGDDAFKWKAFIDMREQAHKYSTDADLIAKQLETAPEAEKKALQNEFDRLKKEAMWMEHQSNAIVGIVPKSNKLTFESKGTHKPGTQLIPKKQTGTATPNTNPNITEAMPTTKTETYRRGNTTVSGEVPIYVTVKPNAIKYDRNGMRVGANINKPQKMTVKMALEQGYRQSDFQ